MTRNKDAAPGHEKNGQMGWGKTVSGKKFLIVAALACMAGCASKTAEPTDATSGNAPMSPAAASSKGYADLADRIKALRLQLAKTSDGHERYAIYVALADAYDSTGQFRLSRKIDDEVVSDSSIGPGHRSVRAARLALQSSQLGDFVLAKKYVDTAKSLAADVKPDELETLSREPAYSFLRAEAEIARRRDNNNALAMSKMREATDRAWRNVNDPSLSEQRHRAAVNELTSGMELLALVLVQNNRRQEAMNDVTEVTEFIADHPRLVTPNQIARVRLATAVALCSQDDYDGALAAVNAAIAIYARSDNPLFDGGYNNALRLRLLIALSMGAIRDYGGDADAWLQSRSLALTPVGAQAEAESLAKAAHGDWTEASFKIRNYVGGLKIRRGAKDPTTRYPIALALLYKLNNPKDTATLADIEQFVSAIANDNGDWADASFRAAYVEDGALSTSLNTLLPAASRPDANATALAFRISELLLSNSSQGALADGAARLAAGDPKLRALIEQEQMLRQEGYGSLQTDSSADKLKQVQREIAARFPVYRELISSSIPNAAKVAASLRPGEAYVNFYSAVGAGFAFVIQPDGKLTAVRLDITRARTRNLVAALRAPFDAGSPPEQEGELGGFDLAASYELYAAWLAPLKDYLKGAHTVYIAAGGVLSNLPWNVLTTAPATDLSGASWWTAQATPVQMPSGSSLVLARSQSARRAAQPFVAFADPSFDGKDLPPVTTSQTRAVRHAPLRVGESSQEADYRLLNRLPETLDEALAIGAALNASNDRVIRGAAASRSRVMKEDLSDTRVVEFATHGLLPGELPGLRKAGLALAFEGSGQKDSILTVDDIVGLRLDADWVILSACNTGFANGYGGESMSELSRGFFAAGTRAVLATQWAVESRSAKELTVNVFKASAADPTLSKADALAAAQRDMMAGKYGPLYRHPYFWAPYFIAGDAAR